MCYLAMGLCVFDSYLLLLPSSLPSSIWLSGTRSATSTLPLRWHSTLGKVSRACAGLKSHFCVVTEGEDASTQVSGFPHCAYKKYSGWNAATAAWDNIRAPITPPVRPITPPPEPGGRVRYTQHLEDQPSNSASTRRAAPTVPRDSSCAAVSAPTTPTGLNTRKVLLPKKCTKKKNVYPLASFGHKPELLAPSPSRAHVQVFPLELEPCTSMPATDLADEDWVDLPAQEPSLGVTQMKKRKRKWYATTTLRPLMVTQDDALAHWVHNYCDTYLCYAGNAWSKATACIRCAGSRCVCAFNWDTPKICLALAHTPSAKKLVVIASNGFHHVAVDLCQCQRGGSQPHWEQLLFHGWFPATPDHPRSAITISALKLFHACAGYGHQQHEAFKAPVPVLAKSPCIEVWGHRQRHGKAHSGDTRWGARLACPKPGVNLPTGWELTRKDKRYLYTIFLVINTCFRLKRKKVSSWWADPSIQDGWAYFVLSVPSMAYVKTLGDQKEISTCTGLAALDHANTKYAQGYAATGCGMITCGRHEIVAKNGVGDLQGGEKKCQDNFSVLFMQGSAQGDMEGIERLWLSSSQMGTSTREMGPGSRQDTLDDFWHYWNWNKVVGMGGMLCKRFLIATDELRRQNTAFEEFTAAQAADTPIWKKAVDNFESGALVVNPCKLPQSGPTMRDIELELMGEEQQREHSSSTVRDHREETMTEYLVFGLEIEGQQCQLAADLLTNKTPTTKELTDFITHRTRIWQCSESLDAIRHGLTVKRRLQTCRAQNSHHQHQNTRSRTIVDNQQENVNLTEDLWLLEDEEEAKKRQQHAMKGKRKEAAQVNENGEVQGVPGLGENRRLIS
ncbi:hypothetical protein K438DRAFT_1769922 [Mycena galopus ATCC 62051]|nr:hypothetical protein K438DRAFT_1769922 [Mycena galopus ATCC 62051]